MRCLFSALSLNFIRRESVTKMTVGFTLVWCGAALFIGETFFRWVGFYLVNFDSVVGISRQLWSWEIPILSITYVQAFLSFVGILVQSFVFGFLPIFMVQLFQLTQVEKDSNGF